MRRRSPRGPGAWACACAAGAAAAVALIGWAETRPGRSPQAASGTSSALGLQQRPAPETAAATSRGNRRLSDERRITRYAHAVERAAVRRAPRSGAARVGRLRHRTEDGPLETYLALHSRTDAAGREWLRIPLPGRPHGRTGWVLRRHLGPLVTVTTMLRVDRDALRATLFERGRRIWSSAIAIGKPGTPTPAGRFWIRSRLKGLGDDTTYGPWAFGTAAYSQLSDWPGGGVVGIHGTNRPDLIPGRPSHGCIRVPMRRSASSPASCRSARRFTSARSAATAAADLPRHGFCAGWRVPSCGRGWRRC